MERNVQLKTNWTYEIQWRHFMVKKLINLTTRFIHPHNILKSSSPTLGEGEGTGGRVG